MERKDRIDRAGALILVAFSAMLGANQVLVKIVNAGIEPAFHAGLRSLFALPLVVGWAVWRGRRLSVSDGSLGPGVLAGLFFGAEFVLLFKALDLTTVARASVMFYTMPVWMTLGAHFLVAGERLTLRRVAGLVLSVLGVGLAMAGRGTGEGSLGGDIMALVAAAGWAAIGLIARVTALSRSTPEMQLTYQLAVSPLVLIPAALLSGEFLRAPSPLHLVLFGLGAVVVVAFGFLTWFRVLAIYPASDMAAFSFLAPVFGVLFGWAILGEAIGLPILGALALVSLGILLINWRRRS